MIRVFFVYHGSILESSGKASKINGFANQEGAYYITTTLFLKVFWCGKVVIWLVYNLVVIGRAVMKDIIIQMLSNAPELPVLFIG